MAFTFYTYCGNIMRSCYMFVYLYVCFCALLENIISHENAIMNKKPYMSKASGIYFEQQIL